MKVAVPFVFREEQTDPIYRQIGIEMDSDEVEIVVDGYLDLEKVIGCSEFYEMTHVYCEGQSFLIDLPLEEFRQLWM
jgi:hypothetical protein